MNNIETAHLYGYHQLHCSNFVVRSRDSNSILSQNIYCCQVRGLDLSYSADTVDTVSNLEKN